jgi:O-antigen ligase
LVEKRNASPDRSHNETLDAMVITGGLGLIVYIVLFASVIYYGLKWLELINSKKQAQLFFAITLAQE